MCRCVGGDRTLKMGRGILLLQLVRSTRYFALVVLVFLLARRCCAGVVGYFPSVRCSLLYKTIKIGCAGSSWHDNERKSQQHVR